MSATPSKGYGNNQYKTLYEKEKKHNTRLLMKLEERDAQVSALCRQLNSLKKALHAHSVSRGRNSLDKKSMNSFMIENKLVITEFYNFQVFPHLKWLHPSWSKWMPTNEKSFCHKLIQELDSPEDGDDELYWHQDVVPLINKCIIDKRSNAYMGVKEAFVGEI